MNDETKQVIESTTQFATQLTIINQSLTQINQNMTEISDYFMKTHGFKDEMAEIFKEMVVQTEKSAVATQCYISNELKKYAWKIAGIATLFVGALGIIAEILKLIKL